MPENADGRGLAIRAGNGREPELARRIVERRRRRDRSGAPPLAHDDRRKARASCILDDRGGGAGCLRLGEKFVAVARGAADGEEESLRDDLTAVVGDVRDFLGERVRHLDEQPRLFERGDDAIERNRGHGAVLTRTSEPCEAMAPAAGEVATGEPKPSSCTRNPPRWSAYTAARSVRPC